MIESAKVKELTGSSFLISLLVVVYLVMGEIYFISLYRWAALIACLLRPSRASIF